MITTTTTTRLISVDEAAKRLSFCSATVRRMLRDRELGGYRTKRSWKVAEKDVDDFLRRHRTEAA